MTKPKTKPKKELQILWVKKKKDKFHDRIKRLSPKNHFCTSKPLNGSGTIESQKFCNILVTWDTIRQLRILLPMFWRWPTALAWCSPGPTHRIYLKSLEHCLVINLSSSLLQHKQNFLNHLFTVLWSTVPSHFTQQMFLGCFRGDITQFKLVKHKFTN